MNALMPCRRKGALDQADGPRDGKDEIGVSHGDCGVVETGTIAMLSGTDNPTTINFLPENHIIVLNQSDILSHYERSGRGFAKNTAPAACPGR